MIRQFYYFLAIIASAGSSFLANYFLSQALTIEDYGRFSLVTAGISIFVSLFMFGQATAITMVFFSTEKKLCGNVKEEIYSALTTICFSFVFFAFVGIGVWYQWYEKQLPLFIFIFTMLAAILTTFQSFFISFINCMDRYRDYFFATLVGGVALISMTMLLPSILGYLIAITISSIVAIVVMSSSLKLGLGAGLNTPKRAFGRKELIVMGWVAIPGMFISAAMGFADRFLVGYFLSLKDVAVYAMAAMLSMGIGRVFISALLKSNSILLMRDLQNQDGPGCNAILQKTEWLLCALCIISGVAYYAMAKKVIVGVFGERFIDVVPILLTLFIAVMIEGMTQFLNQILIQKRKLYVAVTNSAIMLLMAVALNYYLIPALLIRGAVLTYFVCNLVILFVVYFQTKTLVPSIRFPRWFVPISSLFFMFAFFLPVN